MLFKLALLSVSLLGQIEANEEEILNQVPEDWYQSTTKLFEYCVEVNFEHPICPQINRGQFERYDFQSEFFKPPVGALTSRTLFQATVLYEVGRPPAFWLVGLKLDGEKPKNIDDRLWAEAQYLYARVLFDKEPADHQTSLKFYDRLVDEFKGRGLFHQERAWAQFFNQKFERALGSIMAAESPLIYPVPFFEKHFLRALIEKEACQYKKAIDTINAGRIELKNFNYQNYKHPWVALCEERSLGTTCSRLKQWYRRVYQQKIKSSLADLDLLEIELRDRLTPGQKQQTLTTIVWPFLGENWSDELGYYAITIDSQC